MSYNSKSLSHQDLLALVFIAAVALTPSTILAYNTYIVGDAKGWIIRSDYQDWAKGKQFHVGDQLVFKYDKDDHNVMTVSESQYMDCNILTDQSNALKTGNDTVTLNSKGKQYYLCGESGHCAGGQKLAIDVRDRTVSVSRSNGRFGSDFRLEVSSASSSHFVFLETAQLRWLEGVLSTAESSNWTFPSSCEAKSNRRRIVVSRFLVRGVPLLKVAEECVSGQIFFVLIPAESSRGWSSLVRKLRELLEIKMNKSVISAGRSFASVVAGKSFPLVGRCSKSRLEGEEVILVEDEGVQARRDYLSKCLVMRFVGSSPLRWDEFAKAWGIPPESSFSPIGDDLWMLSVSSLEVVQRILALKRWKFKDWDILMDVWTEAAGRSRWLDKSKEGWVVVRGIPLHLRSMELFREIGDLCGGFIGAEDGLSFSTIRIKIKKGALIPEELPICFGHSVFPVSIEAEAPIPLSVHGPKTSFLRSWKAKRKGFMLRQSGPATDVPMTNKPDVTFCASVAGEEAEKLGVVVREDVLVDGDPSVDKVLVSPMKDLQSPDDLTSEVGIVPKKVADLVCSDEVCSLVGIPTFELSSTVTGIVKEKEVGSGGSHRKERGNAVIRLDGGSLLGLVPCTSVSCGPSYSPTGPSSPQKDSGLSRGDSYETNHARPLVPTTEIRISAVSVPASVNAEGLNPEMEPQRPMPINDYSMERSLVSGASSPQIEIEIEKDMEMLVREVVSEIGLEIRGSSSEAEKEAVKVEPSACHRRKWRSPWPEASIVLQISDHKHKHKA
ncbi:Blue copper protein 1b [Linum perenne]